MDNKPVYVTRSSLPPLDDFLPLVKRIWDSGTLTNCGSLHQELEAELAAYLGVRYLSLFNNGTTALMVALRALNLSGEVITTPYSFVATAHAVLWNGLTPVFADVDPHTGNLDPAAVEQAISSRTAAILPVHCYGRPCDTEAFAEVAQQHGLQLIYDAAHCFGVRSDHTQVLEAGDLSILSFHATKVFNTFEGGAIVSKSQSMKELIDRYRNFGFTSETEVVLPGLNGKLSEIHAALGLSQLPRVEANIAKRAQLAVAYRRCLRDFPGLRLPVQPAGVRSNWAYFPIFVEDSFTVDRDALCATLVNKGIFPRRYFYPLLSELESMRSKAGPWQPTPNAAKLARQVLCLPMSSEYKPELADDIATHIADLVEQG